MNFFPWSNTESFNLNISLFRSFYQYVRKIYNFACRHFHNKNFSPHAFKSCLEYKFNSVFKS